MRLQAKIEVVGLGQCSLDYIGTIEKYPAVNRKCETADLTIQGADPWPPPWWPSHAWQVSCAFMGVTGDDPFGDEIKAALEHEGLNIDGLAVRRQSNSQVAFIVVEKGSGQRNNLLAATIGTTACG